MCNRLAIGNSQRASTGHLGMLMCITVSALMQGRSSRMLTSASLLDSGLPGKSYDVQGGPLCAFSRSPCRCRQWYGYLQWFKQASDQSSIMHALQTQSPTKLLEFLAANTAGDNAPWALWESVQVSECCQPWRKAATLIDCAVLSRSRCLLLSHSAWWTCQG